MKRLCFLFLLSLIFCLLSWGWFAQQWLARTSVALQLAPLLPSDHLALEKRLAQLKIHQTLWFKGFYSAKDPALIGSTIQAIASAHHLPDTIVHIFKPRLLNNLKLTPFLIRTTATSDIAGLLFLEDALKEFPGLVLIETLALMPKEGDIPSSSGLLITLKGLWVAAASPPTHVIAGDSLSYTNTPALLSTSVSLMYQQPPAPRRLEGIAYLGPNQWTSWLDGEEVSSQNPYTGVFEITSITPDTVTLAQKNARWTIPLYPKGPSA